jgi:hypothetical protein
MKSTFKLLGIITLLTVIALISWSCDMDISVRGVTLNKTSANIFIGETLVLTATVSPGDATNKDVTWSSNNQAVASVSDGVVSGVSAGSATITVTTVDGNKTATCAVTVNPIPVEDVKLNKASTNLFISDIDYLTAVISPYNATNKNITWSSNAPTIASVSSINGMITGVSEGSATITVTTVDGNKTATCSVTVVKSVTKVTFTGQNMTVSFSDLKNKDIYLVKVNTSSTVVSNANTGLAQSLYSELANSNDLTSENFTGELFRMGHPGADEFHANPPPYSKKANRSSSELLPSSALSTVGSTRRFWVESVYNNRNWVQKTATLVKQGTYCNIWVMNDLTTFTSAQAQEMADKFDAIYPIETSLLGYEDGGGPAGNGGIDNDKRILILVYDIGYDPALTWVGYFWAKDMMLDKEVSSYYPERSNEAEMFYINGNPTFLSNRGAGILYSMLVHEFQHMINYSQKYIKNKVNSAAWYNEMLSMMTEDIIAPLIGIGPTNSSHPIKDRIPRFLVNYNLSGITEWNPNNNVLDSYSVSYGFGAYLLRNYGGAALLKELLSNNSTNINSVTAALRRVNNDNGLSFENALRRFGETFIYSSTVPSDVLSFDKTDTRTIGAYTYTATKFNVWNDFGSYRPKIFGASEQAIMRPHSISVHQASEWRYKSGNLSITLQRPSNSSVEFYLMVK